MNSNNSKTYEIKNKKLNIKTIFKDEEDSGETNVLKSDSILYNDLKKNIIFEDKEVKKGIKGNNKNA